MEHSLQNMMEAGVHFGHSKRDWNPKMSPYIYTQKDGMHIIDLIQTCFYLAKINRFIETSTSRGAQILFVGTKKQTAPLIQDAAIKCNMFFVNQRWLGGLLTNWSTLKKSIHKLNTLQNLENWTNLSKKDKVKLQKKRDRLDKYVGGLKNMTRIPDIVIIIGQQRELNAVHECARLGLRTITILDTDCNPALADLFIPANDDSISSIKLLLKELTNSILKGQRKLQKLNS